MRLGTAEGLRWNHAVLSARSALVEPAIVCWTPIDWPQRWTALDTPPGRTRPTWGTTTSTDMDYCCPGVGATNNILG